MKTIVHTCSSVLVRPNGIVRYINTVMDLQMQFGQRVIFATDCTPTEKMCCPELAVAEPGPTKYVPNFKDGHVWLQIDNNLVERLKKMYEQLVDVADLVIAHDLHSYLAASQVFKDGIFVQHESDVLVNGSRHSYVSDEYLQKQIEEVTKPDGWRIGLIVPLETTWHLPIPRPVYTPVPFVPDTHQVEQTKWLVYVGDSSERKGAKEFMAMAKRLGIIPTVITHDPAAPVFAAADVHTFTLDQRDEMLVLIKQHKAAYIPSKGEGLSLAVLECAQYMPTYVNSEYEWTKSHTELGVIAADEAQIEQELKRIFTSEPSYRPWLLQIWCINAARCWLNLSI